VQLIARWTDQEPVRFRACEGFSWPAGRLCGSLPCHESFVQQLRQNLLMLPLLGRYFSRRPVHISDELWRGQMQAFTLLQGLDAASLQRLRAMCEQFLAHKSLVGVRGLELTAPMELHIAAQACLPVLHLGLGWYRGWSGIVVYPSSFRVRRKVQEESGVVHEFDASLSGEAWKGGPVVLSWEDTAELGLQDAGQQQKPAHNLVIHEFVHQIDLLDGEADGVPPFDRRLHRGLSRSTWMAELEEAFERFSAEVDLIEGEIPAQVDPDSDVADRYYARLPLDSYAATDTAEFFAVSSEAYFVRPSDIRDAFPRWYELLRRFFRN